MTPAEIYFVKLTEQIPGAKAGKCLAPRHENA
jgi:hypothetical protein